MAELTSNQFRQLSVMQLLQYGFSLLAKEDAGLGQGDASALRHEHGKPERLRRERSSYVTAGCVITVS